MDYYSLPGTSENWELIRSKNKRISWKPFKKLCMMYIEKMEQNPTVKKMHLMGLDDGKITIFFEDERKELSICDNLPYQYPSFWQNNQFAVKMEKEISCEKYGISIKTRHKGAPCFTVYKK